MPAVRRAAVPATSGRTPRRPAAILRHVRPLLLPVHRPRRRRPLPAGRRPRPSCAPLQHGTAVAGPGDRPGTRRPAADDVGGGAGRPESSWFLDAVRLRSPQSRLGDGHRRSRDHPFQSPFVRRFARRHRSAMRTHPAAWFLLVGLLLPPEVGRAEPDVQDTRLLAQPAISADHVAFIYADDLWVADLNGTHATRVTSDIGRGVQPGLLARRPDHRLQRSVRRQHRRLHHSGQRRCADPPHLAPQPGRRPRLHPGRQGGAVLVAAPRLHRALHTAVHRAPDRRHADAAAHPQRRPGLLLARRGLYRLHANRRPLAAAVEALPAAAPARASGFTAARTSAVEQVPQPEGRCNDLDPQWLGDVVYFRSDRAGEYNLFAYDVRTKQVKQLDRPRGFPRARPRLRRRQADLRAGRLPAPLRPCGGPVAGA